MIPIERVRGLLGSALLNLPDPILERFFSSTIGYTSADVPPAIQPRNATSDVRLLVAPANYAAQGYSWARAVEEASSHSAQNLTIGPGRASRFPTDDFVPRQVADKSHDWGRRQAGAISESFTHVLVEAQRPILGRHSRGDVRREHAFLRSAGVGVAYVSHGSDLRRPSLHAELDRWSPFRDTDWDMLPVLEAVSRESGEILDDVDEDEYVVTPELLRDRPNARWLPNTVNPQDWATDAPLFDSPSLRLVHAPTSPRIKGTHLIEPVVDRLSAGGGYHYRRIDGVPPSAMRGVYESADVVLEQFRLGIYSTTAIEALAAGRIVVAHLADDVRRRVHDETGWEVPIVEATPDTLAEVLADIRARPDHYRALAAKGPIFVSAVHSGAHAVAALLRFVSRSPID